jgi:hypothetical protein
MVGDFEKTIPDFWEHLVKHDSGLIYKFYAHLVNLANQKKLPIYFIRYEDLL